jgi:hypothetical protein
MARQPQYQRPPHDFKPGHVDLWGDRRPTPAEIADRVSYRGIGKHKRYPAPNGEWIPVHRPGTAECRQFPPEHWGRLVETLREAIRRSCIQLQIGREYPVRAWAYINGTLHEARISNPGSGEYHGFPLEYESQKPKDPHSLLTNAPRVSIPVA